MEAKQQKLEVKKVELEKSLKEKIISLENKGYTMFEQGLDEAIAQVKHFNSRVLIKKRT